MEQFSDHTRADLAVEASHHHPGVGTYVLVGTILAIITGAEVYVYNLPAARDNLAVILIVLSAIKFLMVISFFMHLRFDNKLFASMFGFGLFVAFSVISALLLLFRIHPFPPHVG